MVKHVEIHDGCGARVENQAFLAQRQRFHIKLYRRQIRLAQFDHTSLVLPQQATNRDAIIYLNKTSTELRLHNRHHQLYKRLSFYANGISLLLTFPGGDTDQSL